MALWVRVTKADNGSAIYINLDMVREMERTPKGKTVIRFLDDDARQRTVNETPERIIKSDIDDIQAADPPPDLAVVDGDRAGPYSRRRRN